MAQSLFTSQVPTARDNADGTDSYSMGTYFTPGVDGTITHIRWWFPQSAQPGGVAVKANLFRTSDSAKLGGADASFASPGTPDAWNQVALTAPVTVTGGTQYCATVWTPLRYVSTGGFFGTGMTNGDLSAPAVAGRFTGGASGNVEFPTNSFGNANYFVDVLFEPAGGDPSVGSASAIIDLAPAATGARASQAAAALGLGLSVAAAGSSPYGGSAALTLDLAAAASGARGAAGAAALGLTLTPAASGARGAAGAAALGLILSPAATGSNGDIGCPVPTFPFTPSPVGGYPWSSRAVKSFPGGDCT
jgi:hypothetical protein